MHGFPMPVFGVLVLQGRKMQFINAVLFHQHQHQEKENWTLKYIWLIILINSIPILIYKVQTLL